MAVEEGWRYKPGYPVPEQLIDQCRWLRDQNLSIRKIAEATGLARGTVGKYLQGEGEAFYELRCQECGAELVSFRPHRKWCDTTCQHKWRRRHAL